jgi:hypothetical protein
VNTFETYTPFVPYRTSLVPEKLHWESSSAQKVQLFVGGAVIVKDAEDSALAVYPLLNALAFTVVLLGKLMGSV